MRKYGKVFFVLAVMAAVPAVASADGFLSGFRQKSPAAPATQKQQNQQKAEGIASALREAQINGYGIEIEVVGDVVTLSGNVRQPGHRALAGTICQRTEGVRRVDNNLRYVGSDGMQQTSVVAANNQVRSAVFETTPSAAPRIQQVKLETPAAVSNQQMAQRIANSLSQVGLTGYDIEIRYQNGVATLAGSVATNPIAQTSVARTGYPQQVTPSGYLPVTPVSMGTQMAAAPAAIAGAGVFSQPHLPTHAWPAYAQYPNSAAVTYPTQYSASAFPYIGPFYPYPQVPMGWREAKLEWDDGFWHLNFNQKKDAWYWLFQLENF